MMHFVRTVSIMRAKGQRQVVMKRFKVMEKVNSSKRLLKMAGGGEGQHTQHTPYPTLRILPWLYNNKKWSQI